MENSWPKIIVGSLLSGFAGVCLTLLVEHKSMKSVDGEQTVATPTPVVMIDDREDETEISRGSIEETETSEPAAEGKIYLADMKSFYAEKGEMFSWDSCTDNLGNSHRKVLHYWTPNEVTYKLEGKYDRLEGCFFQFESDKNDEWVTSVEILADGQSVCYEKMRGGIEPISINISLVGVKEMTIKWMSYNVESTAGLGDCLLYYSN